MRVIPIGTGGTILAISISELETLRRNYNPTRICLLEGGREAPGYALMVEDDVEHAKRPYPGKVPMRSPRKRAIKGSLRKNPQNAAAKNRGSTKPLPV